MALPTKVNIGTAPGNKTGDPARTAFDKLNNRDEYLDANKADKSQITALETEVATKETPAGAQTKADAAEANANAYTDSIAQGFKWKTPVDVATTANIALSGEQTIDGVLTSGSRVLVKDQTNAAENGIYLTGATWTRTTDADEASELVKATTKVIQGTQAGKIFTCNSEAITLGTTDIVFVTTGDATDHNSTNGIQGGQAGEYYHLTLAQVEKLNGLEAGATADMTANEIASLYEGLANTNKFTDAYKTKVDGIPEDIEPAFTKNTAFNKNFGTQAGTVAQGNDERFDKGVEAHSWGNHAEAGYLTEAPEAGVESVTGSAVDNTDPKNPVIEAGVQGVLGPNGESLVDEEGVARIPEGAELIKQTISYTGGSKVFTLQNDFASVHDVEVNTTTLVEKNADNTDAQFRVIAPNQIEILKSLTGTTGNPDTIVVKYWKNSTPYINSGGTVSNVDVVAFGDSITALTPTNWTDTFTSIVNPTSLVNMAISGQKITWTADTIETTNPPTDRHADNVLWNSIKKWESLYPTANPKAVIIAEATNDAGMTLGSYTDAFAQDEASTTHLTMAGAFRKALQYLISNYPDTQIFYCTPLQSKTGGRNYSILSQISDINIQVAERLNVKVIDTFHLSGISDEFEGVGVAGRYLYDGIHPNEAGTIVQGKCISKEFSKLYY